jgi:hypothetical protein
VAKPLERLPGDRTAGDIDRAPANIGKRSDGVVIRVLIDLGRPFPGRRTTPGIAAELAPCSYRRDSRHEQRNGVPLISRIPQDAPAMPADG